MIEDREPETSSATSLTGSTCGFGCGDNGGLVDGVPFWGLYLSGAENERHVRYLHFARSLYQMKYGFYATLDVEGGRLRVGSPSGDWFYGPSALENGILEIGIGSAGYYIKIAHVHPGITEQGEPYWTDNPLPGAETYQLQWASVNGPVDTSGQPSFHEVCKATAIDDALFQHQIDAVVFEGEKYDLTTTHITLTPTNGTAAWFNIACVGSLPAKMFLTRRTNASSDSIHVSTIGNDRQAMVRAWDAQYCGEGFSFTRTGHKLRIQDHMPLSGLPGWIPRNAPVGFSETDSQDPNFKYEAVWGAGLAVCLDTPRMATYDSKFPPDPDIWNEIQQGCQQLGQPLPPPCTGQPWFPAHWTDHGSFLTATLWPPPPQP